MGEHLLSLLHIEKLGHPIEEIRLRALSSIICKYNFNLVDETNLQNTKFLLEKLLCWFNFENYSEEDKVLNLMLKVLNYKNADLILKELDRKYLLKQLKEIEKKIGCEHFTLLQDIIRCVTKIDDDLGENYLMHFNFSQTDNGLYNGSVSNDITYESHKSYNLVSSRSSTKCTEDNLDVKNRKFEDVFTEKVIFKAEFFPWQHLTSGDKHVLSSVYDGLRYIDNKNLILQSCEFFNEVLLTDFPTEVFIQRPLIIRTFLQLIECTEQDIRIPVIKCLIKTMQYLKNRIHIALNPSLFHLKKEFYTTSVFPTTSDDSSDHSVDNFTLNGISFDRDFQLDDTDCIDPNLKKYQLSVSQFCFETLLQTLPHLGNRCSQEETNCLLSLSYEILSCLTDNLHSSIWKEKELKSKFYKIFGIIYELLKIIKGKSRITYVFLLYFTIKLLNSLKPPSGVELSEILVGGLQSELGSCISDYVLVLLFPQLHSEVCKYVEKLVGHKEKEAIHEHKDLMLILESMKSAIKFLKSYGKLKTRMEKLECMNAALASQDFHQNCNLVQSFINSCLLKWRKSCLKEQEFKLREQILIKLLANCNDFVKITTYKEISTYAVKLMGDEEAKNPTFDFPGDKMDFLFGTDVLTEIICHGLTSPLGQVRKYSSEIMSNLLKSKFLMSDISWTDFLTSLIPCLSLLQCFADKSTILGRCIVKMFDPDIAKSIGLPPMEILKGNIRFLFSKHNLTRDEAISRLFWLLSKEDIDNKKLPRISVLTGLNLSGICSCVKPQEFIKIRQSFYSPGRLCDVLEMLTADNIEPHIRRSALSQISVMMDDTNLHSTFLEQNGLNKILRILENCLIEREYKNFPDSVKPIVDILKALALYNASVRQDLSCKIEVLYNVLRGLLLFSNDDALRQNAVELLCLLLYNDCILRVPSDLSVKYTISLPELVVNRMCLPFLTHIHWRNSKHLEPSLKKSLMSKENSSRLLRTCWAIYWVGSLSDFLALQASDLPEAAHSTGIGEDMKVSAEDLECLRDCSFGISVKQTLYNIQNATTHKDVFSSIHKLHSYFLLYNIEKATNGKNSNDIGSDTVLSHMLWESTLERFMTAQPACSEDESLLLEVIRIVQLLLKSINSKRLVDWVGKLLIDEHQPLIKLFKNIGNDNFGLVGKELRLAIIELTQQIIILKTSLDKNKWFIYLELISDHLRLDKKSKFYNVAYVDWLLYLSVDLTGSWNWNFMERTEYLEKLIIRIMEIIIAFHCTKDSAISFMGINILRNSLLVLNQVMDAAQRTVKEWQELWFRALTKVIGHEGDFNYCWLLSLWFTRDSITRAAAYELMVGFSTNSVSRDLLLDRLRIQLDHIWAQTLKALFDDKECCFVKEKAAILLSNLTTYDCLQNLTKINFYPRLRNIISNYDSQLTLSEVRLHETVNCFAGHVPTTPSFVEAICVLLMRILSLNPTAVSTELLESEIVGGLIAVLGEIPDEANMCGKHHDCLDIVKMYIVICRLLKLCVISNCSVLSFMLQSQQCINFLFSMINFNLYCEHSNTVSALKCELWSEIFDLFSALLVYGSKCNEELKGSTAFLLINRSMTENGIDHFISSLYIAMTSENLYLRTSVLNFLINLFRQEMFTPKHVTISDIFERKISSEALSLAKTYGWKAFKISESLTLSFGIRMADIIMQTYLLGTSCCVQTCKTTIAECLASLLAVCKPAQHFTIERGLPDSAISTLKQICVRLNLESVENFKKSSSKKKKIDISLAEAETLFKLLTNLMLGNANAKSAVSDCALSTVVHKLWPWSMMKKSLHIVTLKMLCTFTHSCDQACRTLVLSGSLSTLSLKKSPGSLTLLNAVMNQVPIEMDLISNSHDPQILLLCLQLLTNCCKVIECRSIFSKGSFLQGFAKLHPNRRKRTYNDSVMEAWLKFLIAFSSYQDGQLTLTKNQDLYELILLKSSSTKTNHRLEALTILRNVCFHQLNRVRLLSNCQFLSLMFETLDSKKGEEVQAVAVMIWALTSNSQKAKLVIRSSGFEAKLVTAKRRCVLTEDTETAELLELVLGVLKNK